jgi:hypothetical protein
MLTGTTADLVPFVSLTSADGRPLSKDEWIKLKNVSRIMQHQLSLVDFDWSSTDTPLDPSAPADP